MPDSYERIMDEANIIVLSYLVILHECTCNFVSKYIRLYRNDPVSVPEIKCNFIKTFSESRNL
jgi:hypothetical protein